MISMSLVLLNFILRGGHTHTLYTLTLKLKRFNIYWGKREIQKIGKMKMIQFKEVFR